MTLLAARPDRLAIYSQIDCATGMTLAPAQAKAFDRIRELATSLTGSGRGTVVFLNGDNGSGKSHLLRHVADSLSSEISNVRVISGGVADGRYVPASSSDEKARLASAMATFFSHIGDLPVPILSPSMKILAQALELSAAARELLATPGREATDLATLFEPLLAAVARETPDGLLVCMVDDAEWLPGEWWLNLQLSLASAISQGIPMLLVVAIDAANGSYSSQPAYSGKWVMEGLVARRLAELIPLEPLGATDLAEWLGPMSLRLASKIVQATGGHAGNSIELFRDLKSQGILTEGSNGWRLIEDGQIGLDYASNRVSQRLIAALNPDPGEVDGIRRLLAYAALEGNTFTADVVAAAVGRDRDEAIDLFDELCEGDDASALLRDLGSIQIEDRVQGQTRHMWRYGFARAIDWRVVRERFDGYEGEAAGKLAEQLGQCYGPDRRIVAHIIAALLKRAGRDEEAADFARLGWLYVSAAVLDSLCVLTSSADTKDWTAYEFRSAAEVLLRGCLGQERKWTAPKGLEFAQRAFEYAEQAGPLGRSEAAYALVFRGKFEWLAGNPDQAREFLEEALERSRIGSQTVLASAHIELAKISLGGLNPDLDDAREHLDGCMAAFREIHSRIGEGLCLMEMGELDRLEGNHAAALRRNERSLQLLSKEGRVASVGTALQFRAEIDMDRGRPDLAKELLLELVAQRRDRGEQFDEAACLRLLSAAERQLGDIEGASRYMAMAAKLEQGLGRRGLEAFTLLEQGELQMQAGNPARARGCFEEAARTYEQLGDRAGLGICRRWLALFGK